VGDQRDEANNGYEYQNLRQGEFQFVIQPSQTLTHLLNMAMARTKALVLASPKSN
jgi:hypothetical protein